MVSKIAVGCSIDFDILLRLKYEENAVQIGLDSRRSGAETRVFSHSSVSRNMLTKKVAVKWVGRRPKMVQNEGIVLKLVVFDS